jgi:hypothetical protein
MNDRLQPWGRFVSVAGIALALALTGCKDDAGGGSGGGTDDSAGTESGGTETDASGTIGPDTEGGTDTGPPGGVPPQDAIRQLVEARCNWLFNCCATGEIVFDLGPFTGSAADCTNRVLEVLESGAPSSPIDAGPSDLLLALTQSYGQGRIELDAAAVQACADHLANQACTPVPDPDAGGNCDPSQSMPLVDPCALDRLAAGRQDIGDECEPAVQAECIDGSRCVDFGTSGVCAALSLEGEPCFADADCDDAVVCNLAGTGTCVVGADIGQPCTYVDPENPIPGTERDRCGRGLSCDATNFVCVGGSCGPGAPCVVDSQCPPEHYCLQQTCQPPQDGGGPCTKDEHCLSGFCSVGINQCSEPTGMPDGSSCTSNFQCLSGFCDTQGSLTCIPPRAPGEECPTFNAAECADGFCDTTVNPTPICVAYGQQDDPCMLASECDPEAFLSCVNMTCTKLMDGDVCFANEQCISGLCFTNMCTTPLSVGDACGTAAMGRPCAEGSFCDIPLGGTDGDCTALKLTGSPCVTDDQCYGLCVEMWGETMCDDTPPVDGAWCDGV